MNKQYDSADAFRQALSEHLRKASLKQNISIQDLQLKFLIERLLARLFYEEDALWLLKGGFAMELRYRPRARTTKDVDLSILSGNETSIDKKISSIREKLQNAASLEIGDYLEYRIGSAKERLDVTEKSSVSFPVEALLAGKTFGRFRIDVGFDNPFISEPEILDTSDVLSFVDITPARILAVPKAQQFAEKLHAYTHIWRDRENTRVKDLVDMVMLIERGRLSLKQVKISIEQTYEHRDTHAYSKSIAPPPKSWKSDYQKMAKQVELSAIDLSEAFDTLSNFIKSLSICRV